jgi:hypothetical protein
MQGVPSKHPAGAVCLITGDLTRYALSMQCLMSLKVPPGSANAWHCGVLIAKSLNDAFQSVINNPTLQWAWVMGDDHTFEPDILLKLLDREKDVIAPLCLNRLPPMDPTIIEQHHKPNGRLKYLEDLPIAGLYKLGETETCGDAGLLVRRNVLEKIGHPWYDNRKSGGLAADDQAFISSIKEAGFPVYVDMDVQLGHIGNVAFVPIKKNGRWEVRLFGGSRHLVDLGPMSRSSEAFRIAAA